MNQDLINSIYFQGTGLKNLNKNKIANFKIPLPPLEIQRAIVKILDSFTELEKELEARKKQYEYYREKLLSKDELERRARLSLSPSARDGEYFCHTERSEVSKTRESNKIAESMIEKRINKLDSALQHCDSSDSMSSDLDSSLTLFAQNDKERDSRNGKENGQFVKMMSLGKIGEFVRGNGLQKKDFVESGVPCIHYGQIYTYYGTFTHKTKSFVSESTAKKLKKAQTGDIILAVTGEDKKDICKAVAWLGKDEIVTGGHATIFKHTQNPKFISYWLQTDFFSKQKTKIAYGTKVIDVAIKDLQKVQIPLPHLKVQNEVVEILDRFDSLVNDITQGLPAEINARKKQYEFYREKLLSFKEMV